MAALAHATEIGEHHYTGELVASLRRSDGGLVFARADIERFRDNGARLAPVTLLTWLRDLSILAITLRDDMKAPTAATQIERGLIDPLTIVLDDHVANRGAADVRAQNAEAAASAERKKLSHKRIVSALPQSSSLAGAMIRPKTKRRDA